MMITIALMAVGMLMLALTPGYEKLGIWSQVIITAILLSTVAALFLRHRKGRQVAPV